MSEPKTCETCAGCIHFDGDTEYSGFGSCLHPDNKNRQNFIVRWHSETCTEHTPKGSDDDKR